VVRASKVEMLAVTLSLEVVEELGKLALGAPALRAVQEELALVQT
jgi:hypothetical protein